MNDHRHTMGILYYYNVHGHREKLWLRPVQVILNVMSHELSPTLIWSLYVSWSTLICLKKKDIWAIFTLVFKYLGCIYKAVYLPLTS